MSLLSVSVQLYGKPKLVEKVSARSFYPAPNVDSAILRIDVYPDVGLTPPETTGFFNLVRAGFSANRKQIINPLAHSLAEPKEKVASLLAKAGIDQRRRAETLDIKEWLHLFRIFQTKEW
jgi:16S rRNA (adenine1518-N6/adenine1519-N6)-dimethyltransferase